MNKYSLTLIALLTGLLAAVPAGAKTFYKWVDENGATHYSERKPHDQQAEAVSIRGGRTTSTETPADTAGEEAEEEAAPQAQAQAQPASRKDPDRCQRARQNIQTLNNNARVRVQDDNGEYRYLSEEEKQQQMADSQQIASESC